ncbi:hypothetical protein [Salinivibrio phage CW02]|uniref:Uncharacterized protein n=1 Tax=Salinivibrio phage CW02 TaxID=1161935 RepID=H9D1J3_9CAUD|nr:hypothetical protein F490_gp02 [Salinivibrio phage CW02]AFE86235.1 hypothetical protein [Salinivibrio phage CW02]
MNIYEIIITTTTLLPFVAIFVIPFVLISLTSIREFLTRKRKSGVIGLAYFGLIQLDTDEIEKVRWGFMGIAAFGGVSLGFVGFLVGILINISLRYVGIYTLTPVVVVAALFLLRFLFDLGHGLKHNKGTGELQEIDELKKRLNELEKKEGSV